MFVEKIASNSSEFEDLFSIGNILEYYLIIQNKTLTSIR